MLVLECYVEGLKVICENNLKLTAVFSKSSFSSQFLTTLEKCSES